MLIATPEFAVLIRLPITFKPICNWPKVAASEKLTPGAILVRRRSAPGAPNDTVLDSLAMELAPIATALLAPLVTCAFAPNAMLLSPKACARAPTAMELAPAATASKPPA
jgi:hypothetical protein